MCAWGKPKESSFTIKLSSFVGDLKRKHKTIAAQRVLLLDFISAPPSTTIHPLFPFVSSRISSQSRPPHHFASHTSPPTSLGPSPLQSSTFLPPGTSHSPPLLHVHGSHSAPVTPQESPSRSIGTTHSPLPHIHASRSAPITPQESPSRSIAPPFIAEKKALLLSSSGKKNPSLTSSPAAPHCHHGKHVAHRALWATSLLVLLCIFFCISKEIALAVTVTAHLTLWLVLKLGFLARESGAITIDHTVLYSLYPDKQDNRATEHGHTVRGSFYQEEDNGAMEHGHTKPLSHSSTIPCSHGATFSTSTQLTRRSKSWTKLHSSVQEEGQANMVGQSKDLPSSRCTRTASPQGGSVSAKLKLQVVLIFALSGLFHGLTLAVCMALCCILILSTMESLFLQEEH